MHMRETASYYYLFEITGYILEAMWVHEEEAFTFIFNVRFDFEMKGSQRDTFSLIFRFIDSRSLTSVNQR